MNIEDLISQYIDGELSSEAEAELHHRLSVSPDDRRRFREHVELREAARSRKLQHHPTQAMEMALFARLAAEEGADIPDTLPALSVDEPLPEMAAMEQTAELRPLEPAAAMPAPRTIASDAPPVRSDRAPARRRRLVPLLMPFVLGVIAMGVIWQLFSGSSDQTGNIAMKSGDTAMSPPVSSAPSEIEGEDVAALEEGATVSPESSLSNPLSEPGVMSDAGREYAEEKSVRRGSASGPYRSGGAPSGAVANSVDGSGGGAMGYGGVAADENMGIQSAETSTPLSSPSDFAENTPNTDRDGARDRRGEAAQESQDQEMAASRAAPPPPTPIEPPNQTKARVPTPIEQDTFDRQRQSAPQVDNRSGKQQSAESREVSPSSTTSRGKSGPPAGAISHLGDAYFDSNRATLKSVSRASLDGLVDLLKSYPTMRIEIQGHTDSDGSDDNNSQLSEDRARSVLNYLRRQGIAAERMEIRGYGPSSPLAPNTTAAGRKLNRRVVVVVKDYTFTR